MIRNWYIAEIANTEPTEQQTMVKMYGAFTMAGIICISSVVMVKGTAMPEEKLKTDAAILTALELQLESAQEDLNSTLNNLPAENSILYAFERGRIYELKNRISWLDHFIKTYKEMHT